MAAAAAFVALVALQFGLPAQRLAAVAAGEPAPARFGWQMYSRLPEKPAVAVVFDHGGERTVDPTTLLARSRAEIPLGELLPALCAASRRVRAVAVTPEGGERREIPCPARARSGPPG